MNILLIGYGKMGQTIHQLADARDHKVSHADTDAELDKLLAEEKFDVAIEFSEPMAAYNNVRKALSSGIPVVCGTTGWLDKRNEVEDLCSKLGGTFFYASNFSIGVNLFNRLNRQMASLMNDFPEYGVSMEETHHIHKKDHPSGTAITLAEGIYENIDRLNGWTEDGEIGKVNITSHREGEVPGTHTVIYSSSMDEIRLTHTAHTRESFAKGALMVAEWIPGNTGLLGMDDFLTGKK